MNTESTRRDRRTGDPVFESAVRRAFGHRRRRPSHLATGQPQRGEAADHTSAAQPTSGATGAPQPLRRWSVAELIARAAARSPRMA
jgi:hypothetical protein